MKKVLRVALALMLVLACVGMVACGGSSTSSAPAAPAAPAASAAPDASAAAPDASAAAPESNRPANNGQKFTMRMGCTAAFPAQPPQFLRAFKEKIEAQTDQITVELYEASAFGGPNEMVQGLQSGAFQCAMFPTGFFGPIAPESAILDLPFLFPSEEAVYDILNTDTPLLDQYFTSKGVYIAGWIFEGYRDYLFIKPVEKLADFKGLNIRTYSSDISQKEIQALGANPIIMPTGDLPMALQSKTIDGACIGLAVMAPPKLYEFAKNLLSKASSPLPTPIAYSQMFMDSLPQDLFDIVINTTNEINKKDADFYVASKKFLDDCYQELADNGVTKLVPDEAFKADLVNATAHITTDFLAATPSMQPVYDELQAKIQEYNGAK